jgi:putative transposase
VRFTGEHKGVFGAEPICRVLTGHGAPIAPSTYYAAKARLPSSRAVRDEQLKAEITRVWKENREVYGADKVWLELNRQGVRVARCTTERLMRQLGLHGVRRGKKIRTTTPGKDGQRAGDLLNRDFTAPAPDRRWVADFTYVATWAGIVYVAFVVDIYSRAIVGWAAATHKRAKLVLDALQMALWRRDHDDHPAGPGLIHHSDAGSQYVSFVFTAHLIEAGIDASIGTVGDALDNALMESTIGLYKTELINKDGPWRSLADVELATAGYVDWFNHKRLHTAIGGVPPAEYEAAYYAQTQPDPEAGPNN